MSNDQPSTNRLAEESSPYLLQHAHNPVDWYPWGSEAFEAAARQDKPVFLSIGYATCHWCHVMAHESFEDPEVAARMNETFINIKVDREERPDIDKTYMLVCQMLSGSGGWPLNVFLTPDKKPFYATTYIPKNERQGRPGMLDLIPWIARLWQNERDKITHSTNKVVEGFQKSTAFTAGSSLGRSFLEEAVQEFRQKFDQQHGGFGSAPKFPSAHNLMFLLRYHHQTGNTKALQMVKKTLTHMRRGGLFDHIGRGFHRYSTDRRWLVPHFEKMLYDQSMLLMVYTEAWQCTQNPLFRQTAEEIIDYLLRKMQHPEGGFYSAEDADSEGEEGKFYVWSAPEIRDILDPPEAELALEIFNITEEGNYRDEASGRRTGKSIPHLQKSIEKLAGERDLPVQKLQSLIEKIRSTLLEKRKQRTHPLLDDKILTDWNGLAIAALAKAGRAFENQSYLQEARRCYDFIARHLQKQGALKHRYRNEEAGIEALADDYAFLIWGLTELYEATFETPYLEEAIKLNRQFIDQFWDDEDGGFYFTSESGEKLLGRKKEIYDGALPSSNSAALSNLLRLGRLTGTTEWEDKAETINRLFSADIKRAPTGFGQVLQGIAFAYGPSSELILSGKKDDALTGQMQDKLAASFLPFTVSVLNDPNDGLIRQLVPYLSNFEMRGNKTTAYVCQNYSCEQPTHDPQQMESLIRASDSDSNS